MPEGLILETPPFDVYEQMAADECVCDSLPSPYTLRFYDWSGPGVTFGYSQRAAQVRAALGPAKAALPLTRRPTGGGIVLHESDLTFSFVFSQPGAFFEPAATYDRLHRAISAAYAERGVEFELLKERTADYRTSDPAMNCFAKPVNLDILYNGKKVLGGALRKFGDYMLYQASFQTASARSEAALHKSVVTAALGAEFGLTWRTRGLAAEELARVKALAASKYGSAGWNERI